MLEFTCHKCGRKHVAVIPAPVEDIAPEARSNLLKLWDNAFNQSIKSRVTWADQKEERNRLDNAEIRASIKYFSTFFNPTPQLPDTVTTDKHHRFCCVECINA